MDHGQSGDDCLAGSIVNITGMKLHNIILPFIRFECEKDSTHKHNPNCYDTLRKNYAMLRKRLVKCKRINCQVLTMVTIIAKTTAAMKRRPIFLPVGIDQCEC